MRSRLVLAMVLVSCSSKRDAAATAGDEPAPPPPVPAAPDASTAPLGIRWSNVVRTEGCFFFSGPDGRDDQLVGEVAVATVERDGDNLSLRIGTATFEGTFRAGALTLVRKSRYDFNGPWAVTETIHGRLHDGVLVARYQYEECELAAAACPGRCTVTGDLAFSRGLE